jgi:hypothetical protein
MNCPRLSVPSGHTISLVYLIFFIFFLICSSAAFGNTLLSTNAHINLGGATPIYFMGIQVGVQPVGPCSAQGTTSADCPIVGNIIVGPIPTLSWTAQANAQADFGTLHAYSTATYPIGYHDAVNVPAADAQAIFADNLTVVNGPADGTMVLHITTSGNVFGSGSVQSAFAQLGVISDRFNREFELPNGTNTLDIALAYTNGILPIEMKLNTGAACLAPSDQPFTFCDIIAEYSHTVDLSSISIEDSNGNPVSGALLVAESGHVYQVAEVPEPTSLSLLALGMMGAVSRVRNKIAARSV